MKEMKIIKEIKEIRENKKKFEKIANYLHLYRLQNNLTIQELASQIGVSSAALVRWLAQEDIPEERSLYKILKFINRQKYEKTR